MKSVVLKSGRELGVGKEGWACIAAVLAAGYAQKLHPVRDIPDEEVISAAGGKSCIIADNPFLGENGQYRLRCVHEEGEMSSVNGWLENTVGEDVLFAFVAYNN